MTKGRAACLARLREEPGQLVDAAKHLFISRKCCRSFLRASILLEARRRTLFADSHNEGYPLTSQFDQLQIAMPIATCHRHKSDASVETAIMVDVTAADSERASLIVRRLISGESFDSPERLEKGLSIVDVQTSVTQFGEEFNLLSQFGIDFPALRLKDDSLVPVSISPTSSSPFFTPFGISMGLWQTSAVSSELPYVVNMFVERRKMHLGSDAALAPDDARETFIKGAITFLAHRLSALRSFDGSAKMFRGGQPPGPPPPTLNMPQFLGGPPSQVNGCNFQVKTNSPGLSAYWSGAYYVSPNYLGAPTSPAKGVLQAGTYIFGVNGGAYGTNVQWDQNAVCTLPGAASVHLQF